MWKTLFGEFFGSQYSWLSHSFDCIKTWKRNFCFPFDDRCCVLYNVHVMCGCTCYVCIQQSWSERNNFRWALTILIFVHNLNPVSPKIDLSKRCAAEPTILVILVKRNHWPSPHFLDSGTPRDNVAIGAIGFLVDSYMSVGATTHLSGRNLLTPSRVFLFPLFFCHSYLLHVHVFTYMCMWHQKGARKLCGRYMISCKSRQCCSSFLSFVTFPSWQ